jgi:hypothetical protein
MDAWIIIIRARNNVRMNILTMTLMGATKTAMEKARQMLPRTLTRCGSATSSRVTTATSEKAATSRRRKEASALSLAGRGA